MSKQARVILFAAALWTFSLAFVILVNGIAPGIDLFFYVVPPISGVTAGCLVGVFCPGEYSKNIPQVLAPFVLIHLYRLIVNRNDAQGLFWLLGFGGSVVGVIAARRYLLASQTAA